MDQDTDQAPHAVGTPAECGNTSPTEPPVPRVASDSSEQEFFLAQARRGKDVWNKWLVELTEYSDNPYFHVTFAGVDFRTTENATINFSGYLLGGRADFSGCIFGSGDWSFHSPIFGHGNFSGAVFGHQANFSGATFGDNADFSGATFGDGANFSGATFGDWPRLIDATFGGGADLSGTSFGDYADFSDTTFEAGANFSGATFGDGANFSGATFGNEAQFRGWSPKEWRTHRSELVIVGGWQEDRKKAFSEWPSSAVSRPNSFSSISFAFTRFRGHVDFSGREMGKWVNFRSARFGEPPRFDSMANVDLYGAKIRFVNAAFPRVSGWTSRSDVANQLRRLRTLAEDSKNHDLERDLYIEERKAERGIYFVHFLADGWNDVRQRWHKIGDGWNDVRRRWYNLANVQSGARLGLLEYLPIVRTATRLLIHLPLFPLFAFLQIVQTATRLLIHLGWVGVMFFYWLLADYGRSLVRPFTALALSVVLFHAAYWLILRPQPTPNLWPSITAAISQAVTPPAANDAPFVRAVRAFSVANAVPFVGALTLDREVKERLICVDRPVDEKKDADQGVPACVPIPPVRFQALALLQTIFSALCVFFIALALRNYFRVR
jgi:uncharacterized protein YjbI with pentapeptide repeats